MGYRSISISLCHTCCDAAVYCCSATHFILCYLPAAFLLCVNKAKGWDLHARCHDDITWKRSVLPLFLVQLVAMHPTTHILPLQEYVCVYNAHMTWCQKKSLMFLLMCIWYGHSDLTCSFLKYCSNFVSCLIDVWSKTFSVTVIQYIFQC